MKIVFFGTPDYVIPVIDAVHKKFSRHGVSPIVAVVTQPPRPSGRQQLLAYSPVDTWAFKKKIPIFHEAGKIVKENLGADLGILASYGVIIPKGVIDSFPFGILNIHPSLLPKWRGASPVQAPIVAGEALTGVSIIKLDEKLDHGPIVSQFKEEILDNDTTETLRRRLFERSAEVLVELLEPYLKGKIAPREQNHKEATLTTQIKKEHALIPPEYLDSALQGRAFKDQWGVGFIKNYSIQPTPDVVERFIRAMDPWPTAWTYVNLGKSGHEKDKKRLKILSAELSSNRQALIPKTVQLEGRVPVSWKQFKETYKEAAFEK